MVWENLSDMKTYPRLTVRLSSDELNRVRVLARVRNRSRGQVVRDALNLYFRAMTAESASWLLRLPRNRRVATPGGRQRLSLVGT